MGSVSLTIMECQASKAGKSWDADESSFLTDHSKLWCVWFTHLLSLENDENPHLKVFFLWICFTCILVLVRQFGESLMRCERSVILCSQEHFSSSFKTSLGSNDVPRHSLYLLSVISVYDDITGHLSLESSTSKHPIIEMYAPKPPKPVLAAASSFYNQTMIGF